MIKSLLIMVNIHSSLLYPAGIYGRANTPLTTDGVPVKCTPHQYLKKFLFLSTLDVSHSTCFLFVCSFIRLRSVIDARMLLEAPDLLGPYEPYETNIEGS